MWHSISAIGPSRLRRDGSKPHAGLINDGVTTRDPVTLFREQRQNARGLSSPVLRRDTDQDQAWQGLPTPDGELAEILVVGDQCGPAQC
jgi:hypothetical protein